MDIMEMASNFIKKDEKIPSILDYHVKNSLCSKYLGPDTPRDIHTVNALYLRPNEKIAYFDESEDILSKLYKWSR